MANTNIFFHPRKYYWVFTGECYTYCCSIYILYGVPGTYFAIGAHAPHCLIAKEININTCLVHKVHRDNIFSGRNCWNSPLTMTATTARCTPAHALFIAEPAFVCWRGFIALEKRVKTSRLKKWLKWCRNLAQNTSSASTRKASL